MTMSHLGTVTLETERLVLRRFAVTDAPALFRNWAADPQVTRYLTWPAHQNLDVSRAILQTWVAEYDRDDYYQWAIELKEIHEPIGSIGTVEIDDANDGIAIGYCIGRDWWNQGVVTEALTCLVGFFFDRVGAARIEANHDVENPASGRVMQKCGMAFEGIQRRRARDNRGNLIDVASYAIIAEDPRPWD